MVSFKAVTAGVKQCYVKGAFFSGGYRPSGVFFLRKKDVTKHFFLGFRLEKIPGIRGFCKKGQEILDP